MNFKKILNIILFFLITLTTFGISANSTAEAGILTQTEGLAPFDPEGTPRDISKEEWLKASGGMKITYSPDGEIHGITAGIGGKTVFGHMIATFPDEWEMAKEVQK